MTFLYYGSLCYFLLQKPSLLYLIHPITYRVGLIAVALFCVCDYLLRDGQGGRRIKRSDLGVGNHTTFVVLTALLIVTAASMSGSLDVGAAGRLLLSLLQFYAIYHLVIVMPNYRRLVGWIYGLAVLLSVMEIALHHLLLNGVEIPYRFIDIPSVGLYIYYIPFGFVQSDWGHPFLTDFERYRSYSYFLEPAKFAGFITPFVFYSFYRLKESRRIHHLLALLALVYTVWLSASVAGFATLLAVAGGAVAVRSIRGRKLGLVLLGVVCAFVLVSAGGAFQNSADSEWMTMRGGSIDNRRAQYAYALQSLVSNPAGQGLSEQQEGYLYFNRAHNSAVMGGVTSIYLIFLVSYGIPGLFVLVWYLWRIGRWLIAGLGAESQATRAFACMFACTLMANFSIDLLFTPFAYLLMSVFLREFKSKPDVARPAARVEPHLALS